MDVLLPFFRFVCSYSAVAGGSYGKGVKAIRVVLISVYSVTFFSACSKERNYICENPATKTRRVQVESGILTKSCKWIDSEELAAPSGTSCAEQRADLVSGGFNCRWEE